MNKKQELDLAAKSLRFISRQLEQELKDIDYIETHQDEFDDNYIDNKSKKIDILLMKTDVELKISDEVLNKIKNKKQ